MKTTKTILAIIINEMTNPIMKSKRIVSIILAIAMLLGITSTEKFTELADIDLTSSASGPVILPDGLYFFRNKKSGKYMAVRTNPDGSSNYDAGVTQWDHNGYAGQVFHLRRISSNGAYFITPMSNQGTRLHLTGNVNANGTTVQTYYTGYDAYQMWWIYRNNDGSYRLVPTVSYTRTVNVRGSVYTNGPALEIWDEIGSSSQQWYILSLSFVKNIPIRIRYDSTVPSNVKSNLDEYFVAATTDFATKFGIQFTLSSVAQSSDLNGGSAHSPLTKICNADCPPYWSILCNGNHHRSSTRLNRLLTDNTIHTMRIVGHALCGYIDTHKPVGGSANQPGKNSTVTTEFLNYNISRIMQHELSHNLGAPDCNSVDCIMNNNYLKLNSWCSSCNTAIRNNK